MHNEKELISIIVPVYNVEKYIHRCLDSILAQSYNNIEIIVVDDGSTDHSGEICDHYAKANKRIKVIHQSNAGLSEARNRGICVANGSYLVFVDSDDYILPEMVQTAYEQLQKDDTDLVIVDYNLVNEDMENLMEKRSFTLEEGVFLPGQVLEKMSIEDCYYYVVAWNKLYRRELFADLKFPRGKIYEDAFIMHKIFFKCRKISLKSTKLYNYVLRDDSILRSNYNIKKLDEVQANYERAKFALDHGYTNLAVYSMRTMIASFIKGYRFSKPNDEIRKEIGNKKILFDEIFWRIKKEKISKRYWVQFYIFHLSIFFYNLFVKLMELVSRQSFYK